jgi:hypothetical protein
MKCEEILPLLEPFHDRQCTEHELTRVIRHLEWCSTCLDSLHRIETEDHFYSHNAERIDVSPSIWVNILLATGTPSTSESTLLTGGVVSNFVRRLRAWRLAPLPAMASILLAIGLTVSIMKYGASEDSSEPVQSTHVTDSPVPPTSLPTPADGHLPQGPSGAGVARTERATTAKRIRVTRQRTESASELVREAEAKYLAAIALLQRDAVRHRADLSASTRAQLEQTLVDVDRAIASTRKAVQHAPGDPVAVQYMLAAYSRKVDLLRQIVSE